VRRSEPALNASESGDIVVFSRTNSGTHVANTPFVCPSALDGIGSVIFKSEGKIASERGIKDWTVFFVHMEARKSTAITV